MFRWQEEVMILREEFKRIYRSFSTLSVAWCKAGDAYINISPGHVAYSRERAHMYGEMAKACKAAHFKVEGCELETDNNVAVELNS